MFNKLSIKFKLLVCFGLIVILGLPVPYVCYVNSKNATRSFDVIVNTSIPRLQALLEMKSIATSIFESTSNIKYINFSDAEKEGSDAADYRYHLLAKIAEINKWKKFYEQHLNRSNSLLIITFKTLNVLEDKIVLLVLDVMELKRKNAPSIQVNAKQKELSFYSQKLASFISSAITDELTSLEYQESAANTTNNTVMQATVVGSLLLSTLAILLASILAKRLSKPIIDLRNTAIKIAEGNLEEEIPITTRDEIAELAHALETMIGSLLAANNELREQQNKLKDLSEKLVHTARQAGMADVATSVLHNVGNALNSVNVSSQILNEKIAQSKLTALGKTSELIQTNLESIGEFITHDERGKRLPSFLIKLSSYWQTEQKALLEELAILNKNIQHIKDIISLQQGLSGAAGMVQPVVIPEIIEDALMLNMHSLQQSSIEIERKFVACDTLLLDKVKLQQILVNLIRNAKDAVDEDPKKIKKIILQMVRPNANSIQIYISDNGLGIKSENLTRIFSHGFTTKKHGHGFGLHASALAAKEMGGALTARGEEGMGATFILELPYKIANKHETIL